MPRKIVYTDGAWPELPGLNLTGTPVNLRLRCMDINGRAHSAVTSSHSNSTLCRLPEINGLQLDDLRYSSRIQRPDRLRKSVPGAS
jgi:hypothetical protein